MAANSRNPKYDWFKNPRMTDEQLKRLRSNATDSRLKQSITRYMRARSEINFGKSQRAEWSQKHNWALFRIEGALGISHLSWELKRLAKENEVGKEHAQNYEQAILDIYKACDLLKSADFLLRNISALEKEKNDNSGTRSRGQRRTPDED